MRLPETMADDRRTARAAVLHQAGYAEFGTTEVDPAWRDAQFAGTHHPGLVRQLFTVVEDLRVGAAVARRYPGARDDLAAVAARALAERSGLRPVVQRDDMVESLRLASLGVATTDLVDGSITAGRARLLAHLLALASPLLADGATAADSVRVAVAIGALLDDELPVRPATTRSP